MELDLEKVLSTVAKGPATLTEVAKQLGVQLSEAESIIGALLAHGYLEEVEIGPCSLCPLASACKTGGPRLFRLTERGMALLRRRGGRNS